MLKRTALFFLAIYQRYLRVMLPCSCRFTPSCSEYTRQAILTYGLCKGTLKGVRRILLCQPFSGKFGHDPLI